MDEPVLRSIRCPQCAGPLRTREGERIVACGHCGVRLFMLERGGFSRWYLPQKVDRLKAVGIASAWLGAHPGIDRSARAAHFVEAKLLYVPIWEYRTVVVGWEFGSKFRTHLGLVGEKDAERLELDLVRESVKEPHLQERRFYQAATDLDVLGATRPRLTGREPALPLLPGELDLDVYVLEAEGNPEAIAERGRKAVLLPVSGALSPDSHLFTLKESIRLVYYPLWSLRYSFGDRHYEMTVDARDASIHSARAPRSTFAQVGGLMATLAALAAAVAVIAWLRAASDALAIPALAVVVIVSMTTLVTAWRFRLQTEVEYHEPFSS